MIRFRIVGGDYIDLPSDFSISFMFKNGLFAFENMQINRSIGFQIPATPKNNAMFEFSNDPSVDGNYVRHMKAVELYYSGGRISGNLFFGKYDKSGYSCIFVYGELLELKIIKELGNIGDYADFSEQTSTSGATFRSAYAADGVFMFALAWYNYKNGTPTGSRLVGALNYSPTVTLTRLISRSASKAGVNVNYGTLAEAAGSIGLILPTQRKPKISSSVSFAGKPNSTMVRTGGAGYFSNQYRTFKWKGLSDTWWKKEEVLTFNCLRDVTMRITAGGTNYIVGGDGRTIIGKLYQKEGTQFSLKKGEYFTIVSDDDYFFSTPIKPFNTAITASFDYWESTSETDIALGDMYHLQTNAPEVGLLDLLKTFANLTKSGIDYDAETKTISFFDFNFDKATATDLTDDLIDINSVDRTFLDYAKKNTVNFKDEGYVKNSYTLDYTIQNDLLVKEKNIFTIPFSAGNADVDNNVMVEDFDSENKKTAKVATIGIISKVVGQTYLKHVSELYKNVGISENLANIINNSTTIVASVKMQTGDFLKIKNKGTFKIGASYYICIDGTHSGHIATLTLARL